MKKNDFLLIFGIIIIAGLLYMFQHLYLSANSDKEKIAIIKENGKVIEELNLDKLDITKHINIKNHNIEIIAEKGKIRFLKSDCKDKLCIKSGWLTRKGERAICLPSKVEVKIIDGEKNIDVLSY